MERLTTNKPVDEMSMLELAYNSCYAKDGKARYRDFEINTDARDFARNLMVTLTGEELPLDDEAFDEEMHDNLQYDQFSYVKGLIALFYRNLWAMADLRERLKDYEDKEEQVRQKEKPKTNADRIRAMSDEDLAELLERAEIEGYRDSSITPKMENGYSMGILEWLKSEVKE